MSPPTATALIGRKYVSHHNRGLYVAVQLLPNEILPSTRECLISAPTKCRPHISSLSSLLSPVSRSHNQTKMNIKAIEHNIMPQQSNIKAKEHTHVNVNVKYSLRNNALLLFSKKKARGKIPPTNTNYAVSHPPLPFVN